MKLRTFEFDYKEFDKFVKRFGQQDAEKAGKQFLTKSTKQMASFVLGRTKARTPVGSYGGAVAYTTRRGRHVRFNAKASRTGGLLRRSWHSSNLRETGKGMAIDIVNNASVMHSPSHPLAKNKGIYFYAEDVEEGHIATTLDRIPDATDVRPVKETPVAGVYMLENTLQEVDKDYLPVMDRQYREFLERYMGVD